MQVKWRHLSALVVFAAMAQATNAAAADLGRLPPQRLGPDEGRAGIWAGTYIGLGLGLGSGGGRLKSQSTDSKLDLKQDGNGGGVTLFAGHNWQRGRWVYGIEADIGGGAIKAKVTDAVLGGVTAEAQFYGSIRARGGYAYDHWLFYGTTGLAFGELKITGTTATEQKSQRVGLALGFGAEYALNSVWRLRGEVLSTGFGEKDITFTSGTQKAAVGLTTVRFGAAYKF